VFIASTFEATRSAKTAKTLWRLTSGDGGASSKESKEDKRGPTATAGRAFLARRRAVAAMNTREIGDCLIAAY
jgi:hypothetical protein